MSHEQVRGDLKRLNISCIKINPPNQERIPPSLNSYKPDSRLFWEYHFGKIESCLIEHTGEPIILSSQNTIDTGNNYLDIFLPECNGINEVISSLNKLAEFLVNIPNIKWLVSSTWLGSIANGKLIERYGFHTTDIHVPYLIRLASKKFGLSKENATASYLKKVRKSQVKFIYAPREEFLSHFKV